LVVNSNHPKVGQLLSQEDDSQRSEMVKQLTDLALLSQGLLKGEALNEFIERSIALV